MEHANVREVGNGTQLLIDDHMVDDVWLIRRAPETPVKHLANPIFPNHGGTIIYDEEDGIFKMWYGIPIPGTFEAQGAYAVSSDGINWEKPELGLVEHEGSRANNLIATNGMGAVLKDPHDPDPDRRYKMMTKRKATAVSEGRAFAAFSPDGIHWKDHPGEKSIIRGSSDGNGMVLYDEELGRYLNFRRPTVRAGRPGDWPAQLGLPDTRARKDDESTRHPTCAGLDPMLEGPSQSGHILPGTGFPSDDDFVHHEEAEDYIHRFLRKAPYVNTRALRLYCQYSDSACNRRIARADSDDFSHWTEPELIISPDEMDPPRFYSMSVSKYQGVFLGLLMVYESWGWRGYPGCPQEAETIDVQLTFSRDGWRWERLANRPVFIPRGLIGSFDAGMISPGIPAFVEYGDEWRFYYHGRDASHNMPFNQSGLGVARLPKERLVARTAGDEPGMLITKPFRLEGEALEINANAKRGLVRVEVTDLYGEPLEGFAVTDCHDIRRDALRIPVAWRGGRGLSELRGQVVRLRFFLYQAKLYSFIFK